MCQRCNETDNTTSRVTIATGRKNFATVPADGDDGDIESRLLATGNKTQLLGEVENGTAYLCGASIKKCTKEYMADILAYFIKRNIETSVRF